MPEFDVFRTIKGEGSEYGKNIITVIVVNSNTSNKKVKTNAETEKECTKYIQNIIQTNKTNAILWTGEEPAQYQNTIYKIMKKLPNSAKHEIQTKGEIEIQDPGIFNTITVTPTENTNYEQFNRLVNVEYKFTIKTTEDIQKACTTIRNHRLPEEHIWFIPAIIETEQHWDKQHRYEAIVDAVFEHGFNFTPSITLKIGWR